MKVDLHPAPWFDGKPSSGLKEAVELLDGAWLDAAMDWFTVTLSPGRSGSGPKGLQPFINRVLESRFAAEGWFTHDGRFLKDDVWVRVTFRHQMSLGSDLIDALKVRNKENVQQVAILAASHEFLGIITPNDQNVLTSFEKLDMNVRDLEGCLDIPLFLGRLTPKTSLPAEVLKALRRTRPRYRPPREGGPAPSTSSRKAPPAGDPT